MIEIKIDSDRQHFRPGEKISGSVVWDKLPVKTTKLSVRLLWYTRGKGDRDIDVVFESDYELGGVSVADGSQRFEFTAPHRPFSFSGKLVELTWAVEAVLFPSSDSVLKEISISGSGEEIRLEKKFEEALSKRSFIRMSKKR